MIRYSRLDFSFKMGIKTPRNGFEPWGGDLSPEAGILKLGHNP